ncbi:hypothetical protein E3N88_00983 [Mikania micrantha]|uniref:NAF domain-containing protein n=1 Tax=Mikania micrantha TaxID=192012 RepID=A0A5N6Q143_9ASTR|nr:hypothetical protein E3N88_00983 [Mikania micrantha]
MDYLRRNEYHLTEKKEHLAAMNAFELITMSKGLNLGSFFDMEQGYRLEDILSATNNFSDENLIAEGALGKVYKGQLLQSGNSMNVAIRRFDCKYGKGDELQMEISMLKSLKHKNIASVFKRFDESVQEEVDQIIDPKLRKQMDSQSLALFTNIANNCLRQYIVQRPTMDQIVKELEDVLELQLKHANLEDYEVWEAELPKDYKDIIKMSKTPEIYSTAKRKDLYNTLFKGILIQEGKVWFSLGSNGERNEMVSASQFSYGNHQTHIWRSVQESRFDKIAEMLDISHLNIHIKIRTRFLSPGVNYGVHLVFKFCGARKFVAKRMYVNLTYKMGNETLHAYFATWRDDEWMTIELYRFLNHKELDPIELEFLLESFSRFYCGNHGIYIEGVEFRAIDNASFKKKHEENDDVMEVQQANMDPMQQIPTVDIPFDICSVFTRTLLKLFSWRNNEKQHYMLSANEAFCDSLNAGRFTFKPSTKSRFQKVIELLSTHVFLIKCKIKSQLLLQNTEYVCYLVFKLSEKCCGLHCPVIVRDLRKRKNQQTEVVYFRSPSLWNIDDVNQLTHEREDGWMEVCVWKFKSNYDQLQNNCISMNLKFVSYEGTMSGLIVSGLEFRPV